MLRLLLGVFVISAQSLFSQTVTLISQDSLFPLPGKEKPAVSDLSAKVTGRVSPDSLFFDVFVKDDHSMNQSASNGDRIEIWLGSPWVDFTDYIVGEKGKKTFVFRNSAEVGDDANLERFIHDADYPKGKLLHAETGDAVNQDVPLAKDLRREYMFLGLTRFGFSAKQAMAQQLDRDKYGPMEKQLGMKLDDLSSGANYTVTQTAEGVHYHVAMHVRCLGFGRAVSIKKLRFVVDVVDADPDEPAEQVLSTSANRYYGRPFYFNQMELPFALNIVPANVPAAIIETMQINLDVMYSGGSWKSFGWNSGGIVFAKNFISEALTEFYLYPIELRYSKTPEGVKPAYERLDVIYDDVTWFLQHEVYLFYDNQIYSSKDYRYAKIQENNFFNTLFTLPDGTTAIVLYDYEPVDPLGFGTNGETADEFIFIQKTGVNGGEAIFNIGQRIEAAGNLVVGEVNPFRVENIRAVNYAWVDFGKLFEVRIKGLDSKGSRTLRYRIDEQGKVVDSK